MVAVAEKNGTVTLLGPGAEQTALSAEDLASAKASDWRPEPSRSLAWRLLEAAKAVDSGVDGLDWSPDALRSAAVALARRTVTSARLLALDALEKGSIELLGFAGLSESEQSWIKALHFARSQPPQALAELRKLPAHGYPGKVLIIARCLNSLPADDAFRAELKQHLDVFREDALADLLWRHLGGEHGSLPEWSRGTSALLQLLPTGDEVGKLGAALLSVGEGSSTAADFSSIGPAASVLGAWRSVSSGGSEATTATAAAILSTPWSVIDDLIDGGILTREALDQPGSFPEDVRRYLLGRLAPDELNDEDVTALEFYAERSRRAFHAGDETQLQGDEDTKFYRLLYRLRSGDATAGEELLPLLDEDAGATAGMLIAFLNEPSIPTLRDELLDDRSVWSTVATAANQRDLEETSRSRLSESNRRFLEWAALNAARHRLYEWDWQGGLEHAKRCLKVSKDEHVRDEALNLLACAHHQLGNELEAIKALETALEGEYTAALQANIGVVAAGLDPRTAAEHLGRLVMEAPTTALRVAAAERAVALWKSAPEPWEQDEASEEVLPTILRDALRSLIPASLAIEDFRTIAKLLAHWDSEWLKNPASMKASPHRDSLEAQLYVALASGYPDFIKALAAALKKNPDVKWLIDERDGLVEAAIRAVIDDEPSIGAALFGLEIAEAQVPLDPERWVTLVAFSVAALTANIDPNEGEPKERFLEWLILAQGELPKLDAEARDRCKGALEFAFNRISVSIGAFRENQLGEVIEAYVNITNQLQGMYRWKINREAVRGATDPLINFTSDTRRILKKLLPFVVDQELKKAMESVEQKAAEVEAALRDLPR